MIETTVKYGEHTYRRDEQGHWYEPGGRRVRDAWRLDILDSTAEPGHKTEPENATGKWLE
ncbi:MAG: hypothetical protein WCS70_06860 [Verrucomicrobiota bacterium]